MTDTATLTYLHAALKEVQDTVRSYDAKAQICGIGYIFAIGIVTAIGELNPDQPPFTPTVVAVSWLVVMVPIMMFGAVLYPTRAVAPRLGEQPDNVARTFYRDRERFQGVDGYIEKLDGADLSRELAYEILKSSGLRNLKRQRFLRALYAAAASFAFICAAQMLRAAGVTLLH
ncbi:MAG: hypothetical protein OXR84_06250 [Magnetovibrio sp.]|nr:hypothetical protein [Magnetovibrio sp.]